MVIALLHHISITHGYIYQDRLKLQVNIKPLEKAHNDRLFL